MKVVNRIKSTRDFGSAIKKGKTRSNRSFVIHTMTNNLPYMRIGISASAKIGNAVTRNRIKRQVRAMCDSLLDYNSKSLDIVIIVRKAFLDSDFQTNKSLLSELILVQIGKNE